MYFIKSKFNCLTQQCSKQPDVQDAHFSISGQKPAVNNPYSLPLSHYKPTMNNPYSLPLPGYKPAVNNPYSLPLPGYKSAVNNPYSLPLPGYKPAVNNPYSLPLPGYKPTITLIFYLFKEKSPIRFDININHIWTILLLS